jgi:oxygen-independent coproporphyrinogen III oxidase
MEILDVLNDHFHIEEGAEITFEANPDDLTPVYLQTLKRAGINRLSIGIQSFFDIHLRKMNRRHDSQQAVHAIEDAFEAGFENISTDLIYGPARTYPSAVGGKPAENVQPARCPSVGLPPHLP